MDLSTAVLDVLYGWITWSLSHNLGHRWWHVEMKMGKQTFYAHGEREHHRVYDNHADSIRHHAEDPKELFISFPFPIVAALAIVLVAGFGWMRGWSHAIPFAAGMYGFMFLDHQLHILFHRGEMLAGVLGWFQRMHMVHHETHTRNFFFVSGVIWDALLGTLVARTAGIDRVLAGGEGSTGSKGLPGGRVTGSHV
jgi:hypothetical protein